MNGASRLLPLDRFKGTLGNRVYQSLQHAILTLAYRPGKFFNASFDKASVHNERMAIRVRPDGADETGDIAVVQIAGLVARRIVCGLSEGQQVIRGERFGIIRFGSRLDVYLPPGMKVLVAPGTITVAGETVLAQMEA